MKKNQPAITPKYVAWPIKKHCIIKIFCMAEGVVAAQADSYFCFSSMQAALARGNLHCAKEIK